MIRHKLFLTFLLVLLVATLAAQAVLAAPEIVFYAHGKADPVFREGTRVSCLIEKRHGRRVLLICRRP